MPEDSRVGSRRPHRPPGPVPARSLTPGSMGHDRRDPSGRSAPAYSSGLKPGVPEENPVPPGPRYPPPPGPRYPPPPGSTARGRVPGFTLSGRPRERRASDTPGPAHYDPQRAARVTAPSAPACSVRARGRPERPPQTPGPASYHLPPVMGPRQVTKASAPQYSIAGRGPSIFDDKKRTPGPSSYGTVDPDVYMARAPRCPMAGRSCPPGTSDTPGPSDYSPQQARNQGQTFGIRYPAAVIPVLDAPL